MYTFNYHVPKNIDEATALFENSNEPKYLAGGMTLVASMKQRLTAPSDLIDLSKIDTLKKIIIEGYKILFIRKLFICFIASYIPII